MVNKEEIPLKEDNKLSDIKTPLNEDSDKELDNELQNFKGNEEESNKILKIKKKIINTYKSIGLDNLVKDLNDKCVHVFIRDFKIRKRQIAKLTVKSVIAGMIMTFLLISVIDGVPNFNFSYDLQTMIFIVCGLAVLFGGIITDFLISYKYLFEIMTLSAAIPMFVMVTSQSDIVIIVMAFILSIISALTLILEFTEILRITDLLNRARVVTFLLTMMVVCSTPFIIIIIAYSHNNWVPFAIIGLATLSMFLMRKFPEEFEDSLHHVEELSVLNYFKVINKSGGIPYILFLLFTSFILGFFASSAIEASFSVPEIVATAIVGIISIPIIAAMVDNVGRKTAAYVALFLVGVFCIFFDYPSSTPFALNPFRMAVYVFSALMILIIMATVAGDLSSIYSRGRITGIFLFATFIGTLLGTGLRFNFFTNDDFANPDTISRIADFSTLIIFFVTFAFSAAKDPFQEDTPDWRDYLIRIYIISENGLSLYNSDFRTQDRKLKDLMPNEDLVSGGLTGLQAILKEISMTDKNIEIVHQGDTHLIFHYGTYSKAVLFVKKDLNVFREKLANFHVQFEQINDKVLSNWDGEVTSMRGLDILNKKFFL